MITLLQDNHGLAIDDAIIEKLLTADISIQEFRFDDALTELEDAQGLIAQRPIVDDELDALLADAIQIITNATVADSFAIESNLKPSASSQKIIVRDNSTFNIALSGADAQAEALTFSIVTPPAPNGILSGITQDGPTTAIVTFDPDDVNFVNHIGATPSASFDYTASDGTNTSNVAIVDIFLNPNAPTALSQNHVIEKDSSIDLLLEGGDIDGDSLMFVIGEPSSGSLSPQAPDTPVSAGTTAAVSTTYTPPVGFEGIVTFTFFTTDEVDASAAALVRIAVASEEVLIYVESPPAGATNPGEQSKPVIAFNDNSAIAMIIAGSDTFDTSTINPTSVRFGTIDSGNVIGTSNAVEIHTSSISFTDSHLVDLSAPNVEPNTQNPELTTDSIIDWLGHFKQSAMNVDPIDNDENGEQVVCLTGGFVPDGEITQQFFGCLSVTVGDKEGGGGDPGSSTTLTSEELAIAIADTETLRSDVAGLSRSDLGNGDKNKLVRQVDKVLDSLGALDSGTALFNLEVFRTLVTSYGIDGKLDPTLASGFSTQAQDITDFIIEKQND